MKLKNLNIEALIWILGLIYLYFVNSDSHYSFCLFKNLGIDFCPGCGLGRSIHYLMHFEFMKSINTHPLGIFAFVMLLNRIITLLIPSLKDTKLKIALIKLVRLK
jgi:hypothetical protein